DPRDRTLGTFNPLFPRGNYFGESAIVGPVNLFDVHPLVQLSLLESLVFEAGWAFFWRYSAADGFYDNGLNLIQAADGSERRLIGSELSLVLDWTLGRHLSARGSYSHFFTGPFLKDTGPGRDANAVIVFSAYHFWRRRRAPRRTPERAPREPPRRSGRAHFCFTLRNQASASRRASSVDCPMVPLTW